ncbi:MAG: SurA N-terminal domain-containing protein [Candidatus Omnitrophota bacterium]
MIKFLRNKTVQKRIFLGLAILIIPAFTVWGVVLNKEEGRVPSTLGFIENQRVTLKDYLASYRAAQHEILFRYGDRAHEIAPLVNLKGEAWDRLLLVHHARREKVSVGDKEVVQWLTRQPIFQNKGKFDPNFYTLYVTNYLRISKRDFEEEIRQLLAIAKIGDKLREGIRISDEELKTLYAEELKKAGETATFDEKKFNEEKEAFRERAVARKTVEEMGKLLETLRNKLKIDLETMRKLFAEEPPAENAVPNPAEVPAPAAN